MLVPTAKDHQIDPSKIANDKSYRYGIQVCYGLVDSAWNGIVAKPEEDNA
jgi:hypothetical protein